MWVLVMFDLPVETTEQRRRYARFRKDLLKDGFDRMQYSVYARPCPSDENATVHRKRIEDRVPSEGQVRIIMFTDKQFERMEVFYGKLTVPPEKPPEQLSFF
ncbi:MAG: CRISPR-associated endonuclease Cas2 [Fimbriimonadaceae bacterium]|nr:CRISPR-associated endonuclease Cas2 [Fimbriimonadaceae bacterium]